MWLSVSLRNEYREKFLPGQSLRLTTVPWLTSRVQEVVTESPSFGGVGSNTRKVSTDIGYWLTIPHIVSRVYTRIFFWVFESGWTLLRLPEAVEVSRKYF